jgi:hypothetical protein
VSDDKLTDLKGCIVATEGRSSVSDPIYNSGAARHGELVIDTFKPS